MVGMCKAVFCLSESINMLCWNNLTALSRPRDAVFSTTGFALQSLSCCLLVLRCFVNQRLTSSGEVSHSQSR